MCLKASEIITHPRRASAGKKEQEPSLLNGGIPITQVKYLLTYVNIRQIMQIVFTFVNKYFDYQSVN